MKNKRKYYINNKNIINKKAKIYSQNNQKKINNQRAQRRKEDPSFRIAEVLRNRTNKILKGFNKSGSAVKYLGCSTKELKLWLEKQFYSNPETGEIMNWENYGFYGWHIDHIIPLSSFDLTDREQFLKACCYTNLQPLWAKENIEKGNKIAEEFKK